MGKVEIVDVVRGVSIEALRKSSGLPPELVAQANLMAEMGVSVADLATVLNEQGYQLVIMPVNGEDEEPEEDDGGDWGEEPPAPGEMPEDEGYAEEDDMAPEGGLLSRLRSLFARAVAKDVNGDTGEMMAPDGETPEEVCIELGDLTLRDAAACEAYEEIVETLGCWNPVDAHYMEPSPFVDDGLACSNCVAYCPEMNGCHWVSGPIDADGLCKLWVIPNVLRRPVAKSIVERDGTYCVTSADGSTEFGCYSTRAEAQDRLNQIERFSKADTFTPPKAVQEEAQRALNWIEDGKAGSGFTATGRTRAATLAAGRPVSIDTIRRMASFLARHEVDKQGEGFSPDEDGYPSAGRVAWAAWGGDPAVSWTREVLSSVEKDGPTADAVHVDVPLGSQRRKQKPPTIPSVFTKMDARRYTLGPWYVPDSYDAHGEWTDPDELQLALWDYVKSGNRDIRLQHNTDVVAGEWVEALSWPYPVTVPMQNAETGESYEQEFPAGTVFMGVVWESWAWDMVKSGKIRGYSMGGQGQRVTVDLPSEGL